MLYALVEGLIGLVDEGKGFDRLLLAPRWAVTGVRNVEVQLGYAASGATVGYVYRAEDERLRLEVSAPLSSAHLHILLPMGRVAVGVTVDQRHVPYRSTQVRSSGYVDFDLTIDGRASLTIELGIGPDVS
jgi:hypothetical protein